VAHLLLLYASPIPADENKKGLVMRANVAAGQVFRFRTKQAAAMLFFYIILPYRRELVKIFSSSTAFRSESSRKFQKTSRKMDCYDAAWSSLSSAT
jgi:hypothetical protein